MYSPASLFMGKYGYKVRAIRYSMNLYLWQGELKVTTL